MNPIDELLAARQYEIDRGNMLKGAAIGMSISLILALLVLWSLLNG